MLRGVGGLGGAVWGRERPSAGIVPRVVSGRELRPRPIVVWSFTWVLFFPLVSERAHPHDQPMMSRVEPSFLEPALVICSCVDKLCLCLLASHIA